MSKQSHPVRSSGLFADITDFFLHRPDTQTLIPFASDSERQDYSQRILQRLGVEVDRYSVLNIHRIGIQAPVRYVYEQVRQWDGDSPCWPDHVATVERIDGDRRHIKIRLLGRLLRRLPLMPPGSRFGTLFEMEALDFQHEPDPVDFDNARYLLYTCGGGYPIGIFCIYERSPVAARGETEPTQLYFAVGFDFYGRSQGPRFALVG